MMRHVRWRRRAAVWLRFVFRAGRIARFLGYTATRFLADGCPRQAAGLSYVSLLAIVPLIAVGLAVVAGFPAFAALREGMQRLVLESFLPDAGLEIGEYLTTFVENARALTGPGIAVLVLMAILLMSNVSGALNAVWRVSEPRPLVLRLLVYWALLTLGPLLIGSSLSISGYAFAAVEWLDIDGLGGGFLRLSRLLAIGLAALGFALMYFVVPNRAIQPGHALAGGLVAALLFEALKAAFGLCLRRFPSYQLVYGAVSTVPLFLIWMYLSWAVILFGAEFAAALPEWRAAQARGQATAGPGARLALALSLLARLSAASRRGGKQRERQLIRGLPATPAEIDVTLRRLRRAGVIARVLGGGWILSRDLTGMTLQELAEILDLSLAPGAGWQPAAATAVKELAEAGRAQMTRSVAAALEDRGRDPTE
ncbi:MAG: YihY family inner membrane protein [Kiloniellaceae bacterium]